MKLKKLERVFPVLNQQIKITFLFCFLEFHKFVEFHKVLRLPNRYFEV